MGDNNKSHLMVFDFKGYIPIISLVKELSCLGTIDRGVYNQGFDQRSLDLFRILLPPFGCGHASIIQPDCNGKNVLHYLAYCPFDVFPREICDLLSQYEFDFSQKDSNGNTALLCAAASTRNNVDLINFLLARSPPALLEEPNLSGVVAIQLICQHWKPGIEQLISSISPLIAGSTAVDDLGRTTLMHLGRVIMDPVVASTVVSLAVSNAKFCDYDGLNSLWYACKFGRNAMVSALLNNGVTKCGSSERATPSPLIVAALFGQTDTVQFLLENGHDPLVPCHSGWTLQHAACVEFFGSDFQILERVVGIDYETRLAPKRIQGLELTNEELLDLEGSTPLHVAARLGRYGTLEWLLKGNRTRNKDAETSSGATALHLACVKGCLNSCTTLIEAGASTSRVDKAGRTPLHLACQAGRVDLCESLLSSDVFQSTKTVDGEAPLDTAAKSGHLGVIQVLLRTDVDIPHGIEDKALEAGHPDIAAFVRNLRV